MKAITWEQWLKQFDTKADPDIVDNIMDEPNAYEFFDNGAVREIRGGDYVITADQIKKL